MQADAGRSSWDLADWAGTSEAMINRVYRLRLRRVTSVLPVDERWWIVWAVVAVVLVVADLIAQKDVVIDLRDGRAQRIQLPDETPSDWFSRSRDA